MKQTNWSVLTVVGGLGGLGVSAVGLLPSLPNMLLLGSSIGVILAGLVTPGVLKARRQASVVIEHRIEILPVFERDEPREPEGEERRTLERFDRALSMIGDGEGVDKGRAAVSLDHAVSTLGSQFPVWDPEGRLRTYVMLKRIAEAINPVNAGAYLGVAAKTLQLREDEAMEFARILLNRKVEKMYADPKYEHTRNLTNTLILMNRGAKGRVEEIVLDAIHLWSRSKFDSTKHEFELMRSLEGEEKRSITAMVRRELAKAKVAGNEQVTSRSHEMLKLMRATGSRSAA